MSLLRKSELEGNGIVTSSEPITYKSKRSSVADTLRQEIFTEQLKPGSRLRQEEVAQRLGVSVTPVREAFRILEAEGYVESRPHQGVVVANRNYGDLIDAYEIRLSLEILAIRRIVANPDANLGQLAEAVTEAESAILNGDTVEFRKANSRFHAGLARASGSQLIENILVGLNGLWFSFPHDALAVNAQHKTHLALLRALEQRDDEEASRLLYEHMAGNIEDLKRAKASKDA